MATKEWNLSDMKMIYPRYRSASGTETLSIRVYQGVCLLGINLDKNPKPIFNRHWKMNEVFTIARYMADFTKADPNSDKTLVVNSYNKVEKKKSLDYVFILRKDERKIFHIIIKTNGQTYDFPIRGAADISFGTGDIPEEERSTTEWMYVVNFLKTMIPLQMQLSTFPLEFNGNGGQGGYNRTNNNGGSNYRGDGNSYAPRPNSNGEFSSSRGLPSDDDMFE